MSNKPEIKIKKKSDVKPPHPLFATYCNAKSVVVQLARQIAADCGKDVPADVRKLLDDFGVKP